MSTLSMIVGGVSLVPLSLTVALYGKVPLPVTLALAHGAVAAVAVAACAWTPDTAAATTWIIGKDTRTGKIPPARFMVWLPYQIGLRVKLLVGRLKNQKAGGEPLYNRVAPKLYIGGWPKSHAVLPQTRDLSVLDVTCELPRTHETGGRYLCLPTWDTHAPDAEAIQSGVDWALEELKAGREVYVHCAHGHGRSATVLAAILIADGQAKGPDEAVKLMRQSRPKVRLNRPQHAALLSWVDLQSSSK